MGYRADIERAPVGADVVAYELRTASGFAITAWSYGATLVEVQAPDRDGKHTNVCVRLPDLDTYRDRSRNPYVGATVGRYCRCVSGAEFTLDGVTHRLDRNEGPHHVHGGAEGLDRRVWSAEASRDGDAVEVRFTVTSPDGDQGYPGELTVRTSYRAEPDGVLVIAHEARTTAPTVVGLTNHAFWNLSGGGTIDDHRLSLPATEAVRFDEHLVPLPGEPEAVAGTARDFTAERGLEGVRVDNCFLVPGFAPALAPVLAPVGTLTHPGTGRVMRVETDQPAVGVYTGDWFGGHPRGGICLETGALPDAPNRPDYPSVRLDPGEVHHHRTVHRFGAE